MFFPYFHFLCQNITEKSYLMFYVNKINKSENTMFRLLLVSHKKSELQEDIFVPFSVSNEYYFPL